MVRFGEFSRREGARGARWRRIDRGRVRRARPSLEPLEGLVLLSAAWAAESPGAGTLGHGRAVEVLQDLITPPQNQTPNATIADNSVSLAVQDRPAVMGPVSPQDVPPSESGGEPPLVVAPSSTEKTTTQGINVRDFGAKGDGLTDDKTAIESAIRAAVESGTGAIYFPTGAYRVQLTGAEPGVTDRITIPADLKIQGAGRGVTTIHFDSPSSDLAWSGFRVAADFNLEINDLTLRGPDVGTNVSSSLIYREGPRAGVAYDAVIRLHRVELAGEAGNAIVGGSGTLSPWTGSLGLELEDCDVTAWMQAVSWFCGYTDGNALHYLHARRTRFHDAGLTIEENPKQTGRPLGHLIYVHPNTSLDIQDCHFDNAQRYAIHWYGQSPIGSPRYARIAHCDFGPGVEGTAILTTDRIGTTTLITDCTFQNQGDAVQTRSAVTARGCVFAQQGNVLSALSAYTNAEERAATVVNIENSTIEGGDITQPFPEHGSSVTVRGCVFRGDSRVVNNGTGSSVLKVIDCVDEAIASKWIMAYSGQVVVQGNTIKGHHIAGAISFNTAQSLTVLDNDFLGEDDSTVRTRAFHTYSKTPIDQTILVGSGNTYRAKGFRAMYWNERNGLVDGIPGSLWRKLY